MYADRRRAPAPSRIGGCPDSLSDGTAYAAISSVFENGGWTGNDSAHAKYVPHGKPRCWRPQRHPRVLPAPTVSALTPSSSWATEQPSRSRTSKSATRSSPRTHGRQDRGQTGTQLHDNLDHEFVDVQVANPDGTLAIIHTTAHHPFWDQKTKN